ncbi:hypothetical protein SHI21_16615 [Bacteriovorax sp. PP10]|uniref:Uncharacterized protein n=1 Tax=Bacteriovorax antarcticus TaxID=3088717 RepID=A0ABU5VXX1_9BACT|nr:hypothetical protein [Bacteriovorax sp. PP10]MEA9357856.1 hypothetical protein [Bacteriovorax sp. PP10]
MKNTLKKPLRSLKAKIFRDETEADKKKKNSLIDKSFDSAYSGSSYNAKGNPDHGKIKSNKKRR